MPFATWELSSEYPIDGFLATTTAGSPNTPEYTHTKLEL